jgi:glycogen debranching enzyme
MPLQPLQPLLHDEIVVLRAPVQAWSAPDGTIGTRPIHGVFIGDVRVVSAVSLAIGGHGGEHIATLETAVDAVSFVSLLRHLDDSSADPRVRAVHSRSVSVDGCREVIRIESTLAEPVTTTVQARIAADLVNMDVVKSGRSGDPTTFEIEADVATWGDDSVSVVLTAADGELLVDDGFLTIGWNVSVPAKGAVEVGWSITASDAASVVSAPGTLAPWSAPDATDDRMRRWLSRALDDLDALRLTTTRVPGEQFFAAGSPWFFTLFGRDSIWAARMLLPLGHEMAASTLRVLAALQGDRSVPATAEQPGKIMHELRRDTLEIPGESVSLPPLYYGTVDATPLWVCLLHDAWAAGMPDAEVEALLPTLEAALAWMRDFGDSDGDGLLEYVDETGHGLSNQGWKDSGDSVQWRDGRLATGPIALCEVQAYAFEAATHGADLLDHFGRDGSAWRAWAARLATRFHETFWVDDPAGAYPAIALDADKNAVDTVTSNLGHLLGTGLLDAAQAELVARRLASPELDSGFGLRTMSTDSAGYWPLSYHGGSVWTHDTAIAIRGLALERFDSSSLTEGLLAAASAFDYRMPELHGGDSADSVARPVPYPAACRPQAWSAAAAVTVWDAMRTRDSGDANA